jgi:hypothetical protein
MRLDEDACINNVARIEPEEEIEKQSAEVEKEIENMPAPAVKEIIEEENTAPERAELSSDEESF